MLTLEPAVYVVEDDQQVRTALATLLEANGLAVQPYANALDFLDEFDPMRHGCIVLDVCLPGMSGLMLQERLCSEGTIKPHIILTGHADVPMAVEAMQRGASAFLQKPYRAHELIQSVQKALDQDWQMLEYRARRREVQERLERLTPRECDVLERVINGDRNKVIARRLDISQRTVELYRSRIMEKLKVDSVAELVKLTLECSESPEGTTQNPG